MNDKESRWGSSAWFDSLCLKHDKKSSVSYFSYEKNGYQKYRHDRLIRLIAAQETMLPHDAEFIDVGCATGHLTHRIGGAINAKSVTGVDFSSELLKEARNSFSKFRLVRGELPALPFREGVADVVSLMEVLYYVGKEKRSDSISGCVRTLRPGGTLIFAANVQGPPYLTVREVIDRLKEAGLIIEKIYAEPYGFAVFCERVMLKGHRLFQNILEREAANNIRRRWYIAILPYLQNPVGRIMAGFGKTIAEHLISYKTLFGFLVFLNRIMPGKCVSHMIVFARKKI